MTGRPPLNVVDVLGPAGLAAAVHPNWEPREQQVDMALAVQACLADGGTLAAEAPTGVGKTLAYLAPAALSGRRVIISTHTKNLQEQIVHKDVPLLAEMLATRGVQLRAARVLDEPLIAEGELRFALMKGRANYLCLDRLDRRHRQGSLPLAGASASASDLLQSIADWASTTEQGDRAELDWLPEDDPLWMDLDARAEICLGARCPRYDDCFVVRMRRAAASAEIIVVNHHLLMADLALKAAAALSSDGRAFGEVIPPADSLIIDEAHGLESIASNYFGGQASTGMLTRLSRDAARWIESTGRTALDASLVRAVSLAEAVLEQVPGGDGRLRIEAGGRHETARTSVPAAQAGLADLAHAITESAGDGDPAAESLARRAESLGASLTFVLATADPDFVYWSERRKRSVRLGASPIEVGGLLREHLFGTFRSTVLTSATLTTGGREGGFNYFLRGVGAPEETSTVDLGTPFDFAKQSALYLPPDLPEPDDPGFADAAADEAAALIDLIGGGAFFLFTSYRMMREVSERLRPRLAYPTLQQGEAPRGKLLAEFVERAPAVLFATASFWEGVDVPGDPLRLVIVDRLPFSSPGDPLLSARSARIEANGKSAFATYQLPQAILRLKQAFGRLIRTRADTGVVAVLDSRVRRRGYGQRFLRALPPARRISTREDLACWYRDQVADAQGDD